jgi:hypothetical protein
MRAILPALAITLAAASGFAQAPAKLVDSQSTIALERPARPLQVAVPLGVDPSTAVARFLHVAGERGASYASSLTWVWSTRRGYRHLECRASLGFRYSAYPPGGQRWQVQVGRERCRELAYRPRRRVSEVHGNVHRPVRRLSRRELRRMSRLLEPPEVAPRRSRRSRTRRARRLRRGDIEAMSRELE